MKLRPEILRDIQAPVALWHASTPRAGHRQSPAGPENAQRRTPDGRGFIKELQVTEATWHRWLNQYGSEENAEASKRTKELEKENARLKRRLAEKDTLNEVAKDAPIDCQERRTAR